VLVALTECQAGLKNNIKFITKFNGGGGCGMTAWPIGSPESNNSSDKYRARVKRRANKCAQTKSARAEVSSMVPAQRNIQDINLYLPIFYIYSLTLPFYGHG